MTVSLSWDNIIVWQGLKDNIIYFVTPRKWFYEVEMTSNSLEVNGISEGKGRIIKLILERTFEAQACQTTLRNQ